MRARIGRRSRALLPFPPAVPARPSRSSPSRICRPDTKLRSPRCTRSPVRFPGHPVSASPPSSFATLLWPSLSSLFRGAHRPRFADSFSSSGPHSAVSPPPRVSYLAEPRILFARVIVLRAHIPGETRAQSGIRCYVFFVRDGCRRRDRRGVRSIQQRNNSKRILKGIVNL